MYLVKRTDYSSLQQMPSLVNNVEGKQKLNDQTHYTQADQSDPGICCCTYIAPRASTGGIDCLAPACAYVFAFKYERVRVMHRAAVCHPHKPRMLCKTTGARGNLPLTKRHGQSKPDYHIHQIFLVFLIPLSALVSSL